MVWHTFMLNPRDYLSDCIRYSKQGLWTTGFPWHIINTCINDETFEYETSKESRENFERGTSKTYNALEMPSEIDMKCPKCARLIVFPLTTCHHASDWDNTLSTPGEYGHGFADKRFTSTCPDRVRNIEALDAYTCIPQVMRHVLVHSALEICFAAQLLSE